MLEVKQAVVLCAGKGERMGERFREIQKCTLKISEKPIAVQIVENIVGCGIDEILILTGHKAEQVEECFRNLTIKEALRFIYCGDPYKIPMSALKTLIRAKEFIREPFLCVHGNILFHRIAIENVIELFRYYQSFVAMSIARQELPRPTHSKVKYDENLYVTQISKTEPSPATYMGIDILSENFLRYSEQSSLPYLYVLFQKILSENIKIKAVLYDQKWAHITTEEDLDLKL